MLRIVSVRGTYNLAEVPLLRCSDHGYFASLQWSDAVAFATQRETIEPPRGEDSSTELKVELSGGFDETMPMG